MFTGGDSVRQTRGLQHARELRYARANVEKTVLASDGRCRGASYRREFLHPPCAWTEVPTEKPARGRGESGA